MHFKHPEFFYGLFTLVIPVLVHLFQLRRFQPFYFTNVRFLKNLQLQTRQSSTIKKWLLLLVRCLILVALITAFAQPFFESPGSKTKAREQVILLDTSNSMQATGNKGELLQRSIQELLEQVQDQSNFSLLTPEQSFWNTDIKLIQRDLLQLKTTAQPFDLKALGQRLQQQTDREGRDVIIISDGLGVADTDVAALKNGQNRLFAVPLEAEVKENCAVDSVYLVQTHHGFHEIAVILKGYGIDQKQVSLAVYNGNKLLAKSRPVIKQGRQKVPLLLPEEDIQGRVEIRDANLLYDNTYYFTLTHPEKTKVMVIGENGVADFFNRIYTADQFELRQVNLKQLDYNELEKQEVVILHELREFPVSLQTTLRALTNKGIILIGVPGVDTSLKSWSNFWTNWQLPTVTAWEDTPKKITDIAFNHPLFKGTFEEKITNFQFPSIKKSLRFAGNWPAALSFQDHAPFLIGKQSGASQLYVFAGPVSANGGNFVQSPLIVPVFYNMALQHQQIGWNVFAIGESQTFTVPTQSPKETVLQLKGVNESCIPEQQHLSGSVRMYLDEQPSKPGNYKVTEQGRVIDSLSVNAPRTESDLSVPAQRWNDCEVHPNIESLFHELHVQQTDPRWWQLFIVLALLLLLTEVAIQKWIK
ncbi:MAG: hypothetical protein CFE24_02980 [Flavobacterium sp. BFFFF2]|nr:MAG: hypothetical protein CFE24_02980 [Flavobacterium sp. BFFFF2]